MLHGVENLYLKIYCVTQTCLGNYDQAQKMINTFGLKAVVAAETVPISPEGDMKCELFSTRA